MRAKGKENVWSIDNEMAKIEKEKERMRRRKKRGGKRVRNVDRKGDRVLVSGSMLMEVETVLQTQVTSANVWEFQFIHFIVFFWGNHRNLYHVCSVISRLSLPKSWVLNKLTKNELLISTLKKFSRLNIAKVQFQLCMSYVNENT